MFKQVLLGTALLGGMVTLARRWRGNGRGPRSQPHLSQSEAG